MSEICACISPEHSADSAKNMVWNDVVRSNAKNNDEQWRSQPDNLVPLCKFKIIIIIHFFGS